MAFNAIPFNSLLNNVLMAYRSIINPELKNNSHTIAIDFIQKYGEQKQLKVLDLGCSEGYLGEYLKTLGHHVTGVESNTGAALKALDVLDILFHGTIDEYFEKHPLNLFDVIIFGDVLEHLLDPQLTLEKISNHLTSDGFIVVSLPNITHGAIRAMLLEGRWSYSDLGILDRTHLHFYSKESGRDLIEGANFKVEAINQVTLPIELVNDICDLGLSAESIDKISKICATDEELLTFQNVYIAKLANQNSTRVVTYSNDFGGVFEIRLKKPLANWSRRHNGLVRHRSINDIFLGDLFWGDVFIFQRISGKHIFELARLLQTHGKKVIFEIDDLLIDLPEFLSHHKIDRHSLNLLKKLLSQANLVTCTTKRLADQLKKYNKKVISIQNCTDQLDSIAKHDDNEPEITLVVASSDKVLVTYLIEPLHELQKQFPGKFKVIAIGPPGDYLIQKGILVEHHPIMDNHLFHQFLGKLINPIGLIPLDDSAFSSCKSPIKFIDYSLAGIPTICSNVPPYSDVVKNNATGVLVENNYEDWQREILKFSKSAELRVQVASAAINYAKLHNSLNHAGDAWGNVFNAIDINRINDRSLLEAKTFRELQIGVTQSGNGLRLKFKPQIFRLLKMSLSPRLISKAIHLYKREGLNSVLNKIRTL